MAWPQSQDYNEAIQSPASTLADPELRSGEAAVNEFGLPMPRSGNFADVYEMRCPNGSRWAVKCFTREVPGLRERYQEISRHLQQTRLPFTVEFTYLEEGIRIRGDWYPVLKMQWVEGFTFNEFIRQQLDKPAMLGALLQIWSRMATRLREAEIAHADLQHGNVLLVPGSTATSLAVKLIDYDGMFVPGLAGKKSGEVGHPSYQHPQRLREATYNLEVDRFPLLLVATALRCVKTGGRSLWEKYDNGDNLLFREADLKVPEQSVLFQELEKLPDAGGRALVGQLRQALAGRLESTPLLDELFPKLLPETVAASPPIQMPATRTSPPKTAVSTKPAGSPPAPVKQTATAAPATESESVRWDMLTDDAETGKVVATKKAPKGPAQKAQLATKTWLVAGAAAGVALLLFIALLGLAGLWAAGVFKGKTKDTTIVLENVPPGKGKTKDATIVLENVPPGADVFVDGEKVALKAADGKTFEVHVDATRKKHRVEVKKEGFQVYGEEVEVEAGGRASIVARLAPTVPLVGTLVLENLPTGAQVTIDGDPVTIAAASGKPAEIHVAPEKKHRVEVKQDGFAKFTEDVKVDAGSRKLVVVRLEPDRPGFVALFNGMDLTGWKTHPSQPGNWRVEEGVLIGSGGSKTHLYTERSDYKDFHLRVEARINDDGDSGVYFRSAFGDTPDTPPGYEAQINNSKREPNKTGSLYVGVGGVVAVSVPESPVPAGSWFTLEVIVEGNHILIKINGKTTADYTDNNRRFTSGHIALQQYTPETVAEFRKIEIKELSSTKPPNR